MMKKFVVIGMIVFLNMYGIIGKPPHLEDGEGDEMPFMGQLAIEDMEQEDPLVEVAKRLVTDPELNMALDQHPAGTPLIFLFPSQTPPLAQYSAQASEVPGYLILSSLFGSLKKFKAVDSPAQGELLVTVTRENPNTYAFLMRAINQENGQIVAAPVEIEFNQE